MDVLRLSIQELLDDKEYGLDLSVLTGVQGLNKHVLCPRIQKPGLALSGYTEHFHPDRIQILGNTEISYLNKVDQEFGRESIRTLCSFPIICFIVTNGLVPPAYFCDAVEAAGVSVLSTHHNTASFISLITKFLEERSLPTTHMHGVLVDVLGVGVLLTGKSGVGKSECALDLVMRGHRLVADDVVFIKKKNSSVLVGQAVVSIQHVMEIRGLGIINIKELYGVSSIRKNKIIDIVLELKELDSDQDYDRLGIDENKTNILGVDVRHIIVPVRPGRNLSSIIEVAARNFLLNGMWGNSAVDFNDRLMARMDNRHFGAEVE